MSQYTFSHLYPLNVKYKHVDHYSTIFIVMVISVQLNNSKPGRHNKFQNFISFRTLSTCCKCLAPVSINNHVQFHIAQYAELHNALSFIDDKIYKIILYKQWGKQRGK
jgi:hypothetical protein